MIKFTTIGIMSIGASIGILMSSHYNCGWGMGVGLLVGGAVMVFMGVISDEPF